MAKKTSLRSAAKQKTDVEENPIVKKPALADEGLTKRLNAEIPLDLHNQFKAQCSIEGREMKDVLIELIEEHLNS